MDKPEDGGQAFPTAYADYNGMTLRDWFAGQAMAGLLANGAVTESWGALVAKDAYDVADSMLKEREQ